MFEIKQLLIVICVGVVLLRIAPRSCVAQGSWEILVQNAGIASMHSAVTHFGTVVLLDRTDIGASQIALPNGQCRDDPNDLTLKHDCTAHSVLFTPGSNSIRPLTIATDTWCSSGQFFSDGTLVQTGGDFDGNRVVRYFKPCPPGGSCDWVEATDQQLQQGRWYATNQLLPDGRQIVVGGRDSNAVEFIPANGQAPVNLPFLQQTRDNQMDNFYPFVHLLPNGNLFIFANKDSIQYDYKTNTVVQTYPTLAGEPRNYPSAGSSVMLPLLASQGFGVAQVLVCGGSQYGAFLNPSSFPPASQTCGRMQVTDPNPTWAIENMPTRRNMGDMILLPTRDVLIINGASDGCQGWGNAKTAVLAPVLYKPSVGAGKRFSTLTATTIPRVYHSTANLLPDTRILVAGSNSHQFYTFTGDFPTELRIEAFSPDYLKGSNKKYRPTIVNAPASIAYNSAFTITVTLPTAPRGTLELNLASAPFVTHTFAQGQRMLNLAVTKQTTGTGGSVQITATAPLNTVIAPSAYYMLFVVNRGVPSVATWVHVG
ncbi:hypothetical protein O6H91_19G022900 [Diphasiastrum complanatum]|uniref:Uncharacterized protein n=1 Tax=Diphasiastrum complanatum TaxID=34168 RepID=A0ACC2ATH8_DIPCM|nr:hypothetical protein O6H91_Y545800 [Diphasiastrum complanatum]KAJ7520790.1 hypothetical protein O6H91_19G022900 [Diphasiastrum complanatum]